MPNPALDPAQKAVSLAARPQSILTTFESTTLNVEWVGCAGPSGKPKTTRRPFSQVDHMNSNDLVDHHEVAINSLEFERQVRELRRVTALGWLAVLLLAATLFVVAATLG
jgi:hypothetical protein